MKNIRASVLGYQIFASVVVAISSTNAMAQQNSTYAADPSIVQATELSPKVLLSMSLDHQLFIKAYNDYDNIYDDPNTAADDGIAETTYEHRYKYVGYFDNTKCYGYGNDNVFAPIGSADGDGYCADSAGNDDGGWNGNFLNWLTMTRIDLVRYVLYGGYRSTDTADGVTILERSYLPNDSHSFAKHYTGDDIAKLADNLPSGCTSEITGQCDGYTFCNTSKPPAGTIFSQQVNTVTSPPLLRAIQGNYSLWANGERLQCLATSEHPGGGLNASTGDSGNAPAATGINAFATEPADTDDITDFNVRVSVCQTAEGSHTCKAYGDNLKPTGLLHEYGESGAVEFGLLTGSYLSNKNSGALRSNVANFSREVDSATGQFIKNTTPALAPNSIVANLDAFRIIDYRFNAGGNSGSYFGGSDAQNCSYGQFDFDNGECRNWGNPFSEILAESYRYFSGAPAASVDVGGEEGEGNGFITGIDGLSVDAWPAPDDSEERFACANLNILGFNASTASYDDNLFYNGNASLSINDFLGITVEGSGGLTTVDQLTDVVGGTAEHGELMDGNYFVGGVVGGVIDNECSAKTIDGALSKVRGTCPEAPRLNGTYLSAGLAHYFHTQANRKISTYGVTMAGATPNIKIKVSNTQELVLIPACRNWDGHESRPRRAADPGRCALAAFKPIETSTDGLSGTYMIGWEDTEQGGDYDLDLWGTLHYVYAGGALTVDTKLIHESTGDELDFGFVVSGTKTDRDGAYYPAMTADDPGLQDGFVENENTTTTWCSDQFDLADANPSCAEATVTEGGKSRYVQTMVFTVNTLGASTAGTFLEEPLYYASKWGSFTDQEGGLAGIPDNDSEWKIADEQGNYNELSGYTSVSDPAKLTTKMRQIFKSLLERPSVATATGVSLSSSTGVGLMVNSLYFPEKKNGDNKINWVGFLTGMLRDQNGYLREAGNNNSIDPDDSAIVFVNEDGLTTATRNIVTTTGDLVEQTSDIALESVDYLWDAQTELASIPEDNYATQRTYRASAGTGRYIITGNKEPGFTQVTKTLDFTTAAESMAVFGDYLITDAAAATDENKARLVNFIRGVEVEGMRSRTLDNRKYLLGDTVNSTPVVVGKPKSNYDLRKGDESYRIYREKYENRRQVVYVGANDGMLHAFNAGFLNQSGVGYNLGKDDVTKHPLGSELWSYVPYNLLPHLQWLSSKDYSHVFYVDGQVQEFDVNIFDDDAVHPGGWGTIIVVGMRLGGGEIVAGGETFRSAYVIMDVTDPENPPELIAEVSDADLGFTMANAQLMVNRTPRSVKASQTGAGTTLTLSELGQLSLGDILGATDQEVLDYQDSITEELLLSDPDNEVLNYIGSTADRILARQNEWYLVLGSGPTSISTATSAQPAKLFYLDLKDAVETNANPQLTEIAFDSGISPEITQAFVGGINVTDWDRDFKDDAIYFGLVENSISNGQAVRGRLMHAVIDFGNNSVSVEPAEQFLTGSNSTDYSFSTKPYTIADLFGLHWVYAGTGRFLVSSDSAVDNVNAYFGVIANQNANTDGVALSDLVDVSDARLYVRAEDKRINHVRANNSSTGLDAFNGSISIDYSGWFREFESDTEIVSVESAFFNDSLVVNTYDPSESSTVVGECSSSPGTSYGYVFDMFNGLPQINLRNLKLTDTTTDDGLTEVATRQVVFSGFASGATVVNRSSVIYRIGVEDLGSSPHVPDYVDDENSDTKVIKKPAGSEDLSGVNASSDGSGGIDLLSGSARRSWREIYLEELN